MNWAMRYFFFFLCRSAGGWRWGLYLLELGPSMPATAGGVVTALDTMRPAILDAFAK